MLCCLAAAPGYIRKMLGQPDIWNLKQYWWTYLRGRNRDTDRESRLVDTEREERLGRTEWVALTVYTSPCEIDSGELLYTRSSAWASVPQRGWGWCGGKEEGGDICIIIVDSCFINFCCRNAYSMLVHKNYFYWCPRPALKLLASAYIFLSFLFVCPSIHPSIHPSIIYLY